MRIVTKGLKARDHELELGRLTVLVGPNGSGKSTVSDALRFAALGYVPAFGKRPVDTAALMAGDSLSVDVSLEGGKAFRRSIDRREKGYVAGAEASWLRNCKPSEAGKEIVGLFGDEEQDAAECLDIRQLLAATPNQRAARIEQLLAAGAMPPAEKAKAVARLTVQRLLDLPDERMPADYAKALPMVAESQMTVLKIVAPMLEAKVRDAGTAGAIAWANEAKREAATGLRQKEQAEKELRTRLADITKSDPAEIGRLEMLRGGLEREAGAASERERIYWDKAARIERAKSECQQTQKAADSAMAALTEARRVQDAETSRLEKESAEATAGLANRKQPTEPDDSEARAAEVECDRLAAEADEITLPEVPSTHQEQYAVQGLEADLQEAKASPWAPIIQAATEIHVYVTDTERKLTAADRDFIDHVATRIAKLARSQSTDPEQIGEALGKAKDALQKAMLRRDEAEAALAAAERQKDALRAQAAAKRRRAAEIRGALAATWREAVERHRTAHDDLMHRFRAAEDALKAIKGTIASAEDGATRTGKAAAGLAGALSGMGPLGEPPPAADALRTKLADITELLARELSAQAARRELERILKAIDDCKAERDVNAAIEWALQRQRDREISDAGGPLMRTLGDYLKAAGRSERPYIRAGAGACEIGWATPAGAEVSVQALSGGEWALFAAGLTAAVVLIRRSVLKILLVEAGETDDTTLAQILAGVGSLAEGLTAAIVMTPRAPRAATAGWKVVEMAEARETAKA
jgi:DNA repair exonuclease SbcCD ATPase subunit